ncbi:cobalamin-dependent protein [Desulfococcaceae bacterium HSG7]|nr:cobalamin-dependent protein [Desulfococcaceae bacterium HSG7]
MDKPHPVHPLKTRAKILLSGVFGPYSQDDAYGSRRINPMELYHNQVTRVQGAFSLRMFHRSFGLMMMQANIKAPCHLLDFPTLDRFIEELQEKKYDIVGISAITVNIGKVKKMCALVRQYLPHATIVIGGHIANKGGLEETIDADYIVKGDGIKWFREFLGDDTDAPVTHPLTYSAHDTRILGHTLREKPGDTAAILIPSVGCPVGCNFCSTSALFGGKGNFINFYETGDELYTVMLDIEKKLKVQSFFIMDENFLLHRKRALRLLELMEAGNKSWALFVFSSARVIRSYTMEQLIGLGISWVWMGLEGEASQYRKLNDVDTHELVRSLQDEGIRVLGSSIIGMENHTAVNIDRIIDYAISHNTVFHQFMLYTPNPGTPLYEKHKKDGSLYDEAEFPTADAHGQYRFNYRHKHISDGQEEQFILNAFQRDFDVNGPSLARLIQTLLKGWQKYKNCADKRIRERYRRETMPIRTTYAGAVWAMGRRFRRNKPLARKMKTLLGDIYHEFGLKTRIVTPVIGLYLYISLKREEKKLANDYCYEPAWFYEKNKAALDWEKAESTRTVTRITELTGNIAQQTPVMNRY